MDNLSSCIKKCQSSHCSYYSFDFDDRKCKLNMQSKPMQKIEKIGSGLFIACGGQQLVGNEIIEKCGYLINVP